MQYESRIAGQGIAQNPMAAATAPIEKPRLSLQLDQLHQVISACMHAAVGINVAADRMLGPVPQDASKEGPKPTPCSIEQRFAEVIAQAERLHNELEEGLRRINTAV